MPRPSTSPRRLPVSELIRRYRATRVGEVLVSSQKTYRRRPFATLLMPKSWQSPLTIRRHYFARAQSKASSIFDVALRVFQTADKEGVPPSVAADRLAEERMSSVGRLATIRL